MKFIKGTYAFSEEELNILKTTKVKKVICEKLNTSFYKLTKFIKKTYGTEDIEEISRMCATQNDKN